ncbi:RidA family protein [Salidesulfovibrio onnuriiensis]|uniref:RidA family protein n=1 Tax=Salidesulfovibrio onnuriiensis TaxID=2583823 RepID=UPI0011CBD717|nr:RidA family protein [Salidesulfovibrio onnuriiensis]
MPTPISTEKAPAAVGPYSQGMISGNMVFTSGQLPIVAETGIMPETIEEQAKASLENVKAVLEAAGSSMGRVVKTSVFLKNITDFAAVNEVYATYFGEPFPARSCFEVSCLPKDALVEIEVIAEK